MNIYKTDNKGNIGIAIVITLIAVLSGVSLALVAFQDSVSFRLQLDGLQQFHILRSEVGRGRLIAGHFDNLTSPPMQSVLPTRAVPVEFGTNRTVYYARTKLDLYSQEEATGYYIRSLITGVRGDGSLLDLSNQSPVKRYGENKILSLQTIALFHYFSDIDRTINDGLIVFAGLDIIYGRVHSNTDITVNYSIYGNWPVFYGLVSTGGVVRPPGGYPRDDIFRGPAPALIEEHPRIAFTPTADRVRTHGNYPYGADERDDMICYITVNGTSYEVWFGEIRTDENPTEWIEGYNKFTVYSSYPPYGPVGNEIGVNYIPKTDTIWTPASGGSVNNTSVFIPMELWISGDFSSRQTWASSHDIYLKDDLTYRNTPPGQRPDGIDEDGEQTLPVNTTDYLGIISEQSVYIQYGHRSPIDSLRYRPNTSDIYMYGAYCATGDGDVPWKDGVVSFQYQMPKGSTPAQYWRGEYFKFIDLHLFNYPTTAMNPWPRGMDYPWYNPLWPEPGILINVPGLPGWTPNPHNADEVVERRGDIWIFGSIAQRRRGVVGNPGVEQGIWDIHNEINPNTGPTYGASGPIRVGYGKRYHTDLRFERTGPPHFPLILLEGYDSEDLRDLGYLTERWVFKNPPPNF